MKIALCHSMQFADEAKEVQEWFEEKGHHAFPSSTNEKFIGLSDEEQEELKLEEKLENDAMREHWSVIKKSDKVLALNYDKNEVENYVGGNTLLEMSWAYIMKKPIYLLNPIPEIEYYKYEIEAMKPEIINGDLKKVLK